MAELSPKVNFGFLSMFNAVASKDISNPDKINDLWCVHDLIFVFGWESYSDREMRRKVNAKLH